MSHSNCFYGIYIKSSLIYNPEIIWESCVLIICKLSSILCKGLGCLWKADSYKQMIASPIFVSFILPQRSDKCLRREICFKCYSKDVCIEHWDPVYMGMFYMYLF